MKRPSSSSNRGTARSRSMAHWSGSRSTVFDDRATAVYVPPGATLTIAADAPLEGVLTLHRHRLAAPTIATPTDVVVNPRGRGNYTREVHDIFVRDPHVRRLMVGETFNPPGNWSSYPPHKHDGRNGEPALEEVYYFRIDPPQGFGHQVLYTSDGESVTHQVRDGDTVPPTATIPCRPRRVIAFTTCGRWRANKESSRSMKIPRIAGSTTRPDLITHD